MKRRLATAALLAVLASCGSSAASSHTTSPGTSSSDASSGTPPPGRRQCGPPGATTLSSSLSARVYSWHGGVFGCSFARGRSFRLGSAARSIRESRVDPVAVAGNCAAYGLSNFGVDTVRTDVVVRRLSDGTRLAEFPATRAAVAEGFQSVGSVAVRSDGAVGWIASERSIMRRGQSIEVHAAGASASADRVLDSGPQVVPQSLRLHGSLLTWKHGAATRHATLP